MEAEIWRERFFCHIFFGDSPEPEEELKKVSIIFFINLLDLGKVSYKIMNPGLWIMTFCYAFLLFSVMFLLRMLGVMVRGGYAVMTVSCGFENG